jgi:hypothetical protein
MGDKNREKGSNKFYAVVVFGFRQGLSDAITAGLVEL